MPDDRTEGASLGKKEVPYACRRVDTNQGQTDQRQANAPSVSDIPASPVGSVFAFEFKKGLVAIDMIKIFEEKVDHLFLRHQPGGRLFRIGQGSKAEVDAGDSAGIEMEDRFNQDEIHDIARIGKGAHQVKHASPSLGKRPPCREGDGLARGIEGDCRAVSANVGDGKRVK